MFGSLCSDTLIDDSHGLLGEISFSILGGELIMFRGCTIGMSTIFSSPLAYLEFGKIESFYKYSWFIYIGTSYYTFSL